MKNLPDSKKIPSVVKQKANKINNILENPKEFFQHDLEVPLEQLMKFFDTTCILEKLPEEEKLIILIDIVGFSKSDTKTQVMNIYMFQKFIRGFVLSNKFLLGNKINITGFIPTGDGSYILADKCNPQSALKFLFTMIAGFQNIASTNGQEIALRASALYGKCVPFFDLAYHKNYIGEGMNEASRVLSCGRAALENQYMSQNHTSAQAKDFSKNSLFLDDTLAPYAADYKKNASNTLDFFDVADKHGKTRNITVFQAIHRLR